MIVKRRLRLSAAVFSPSGRGERDSQRAGAPGEGRKSLQILRPSSKTPVQLGVGEVCIWAAGINASNHRLTGSVGNVECERCLRIELVICAQIEYVRESLCTAGRTPGESEGFLLKSSASDVPEILCVRQIQRMCFGSKNQLSIRCYAQLSETVFVVHQVVEWKTGKRTRSRQFLKERAMSAARGIVVSASAKVSAADPRFDWQTIPLVTALGGECIRAMSCCSPRSTLDRSPKQDIGFAGP